MIRETFENWYSNDGKFKRAIERDGDGYLLKHAQNSWEAWQIAAAVTATSCAEIACNTEPPKSIGRQMGRHHSAGAQHAAKRIREEFKLSD